MPRRGRRPQAVRRRGTGAWVARGLVLVGTALVAVGCLAAPAAAPVEPRAVAEPTVAAPPPTVESLAPPPTSAPTSPPAPTGVPTRPLPAPTATALPRAAATAPAVPAMARLLPDAAPAPGRPVLPQEGLYIPPSLDRSRPARVLMALHGMSGTGGRIAQRLKDCADRQGWVLLAPSMQYRDYMDPEQVRVDDQEILPRIRQILDDLPSLLPGLRIDPHALVYGFSRGAQLAHRFAFFYPDRVTGVAALSAGSYTLPKQMAKVDGRDRVLLFPFGVADLERYTGRPFSSQSVKTVAFWVGVGGTDTASAEVPRPWDPFLGKTRVERARSFSETLRTAVGSRVLLQEFSGSGHEETATMRDNACAFLGEATGRAT